MYSFMVSSGQILLDQISLEAWEATATTDDLR
jgi:hypothetical protein